MGKPISATWFEKYHPTKNRIFVKVLGPEDKRGDAIILEVKEKKPAILLARVEKIGYDCSEIQEGDVVILPKHMYAEDKELKYLFCRETEVLGVLEPDHNSNPEDIPPL